MISLVEIECPDPKGMQMNECIPKGLGPQSTEKAHSTAQVYA